MCSLRAHKFWSEKVCNTYVQTLCKISIVNKSTFTAAFFDKAMRKRWVDISRSNTKMDENFFLSDITNYPRDIIDEALRKFESLTPKQFVKPVT
jgi:hypothetical protein